MSEATSLSDYALAALISYGPLALGLTLLLGGIGIPVPGTVLLLAAGAFAQQGFIQWPWALAAGLAGVVVGDAISYGIGRMGGAWAERRFAGSNAWSSATDQFNRRGGMAVFLTRFLITPLALPVNLIAGISAYAFARFMIFDLLGEMVWMAGYGGIGYVLGTQWQAASQLLSDSTGLVLGIALLVSGVVIGVRMLLKRRARAAEGELAPAEAVEAAPALGDPGPLS